MSKTTSKGSSKIPPPQVVSSAQDDSDDSDYESEDAVTNVQLGLSDGQVEGDDESNPLISRIGGKAAWLPTQEVPPPSISHCKYCNTPMELLVQIFAPLEKSPYDRTLLAWGCCRPACQRKGQGSLRVIRHLQFNARWAARLEKQKQKKAAREERKRQQLEQTKARKAEEEAKSKINPFSTTNTSASSGLGGGLFGGGFGSSDSNPFAASTAPSNATSTPDAEAEPDDESDSDESDIDSEAEEEERLADELAMKAAVEEASSSNTTREAWKSQSTSYQPSLYLSTVPESSSSAKAGEKAHQKAQQSKEEDLEQDDDDEDAAEFKSIEKEGYEKMMLAGMDDVLERFIARVGAEGRQVVRYEMGGQPLPFSAQGELYKQLWPTNSKSSNSVAVSRGNHHVNTPNASKPTYDPSRVPPCEICGSKRTFEFQLMPNLVNTLRANQIQGDTQEDESDTEDAKTKHRREVEAVLGKSLSSQPNSNGVSSTTPMNKKTGLCWSTAIVFVCEKDCCIPNNSTKEGETWREEWVGIQFED